MTTDENSNQPLIAIIVLILGMTIFLFLFNKLHENKQKHTLMTERLYTTSANHEVIEGGEIIQGNTYFGYWRGYIVQVGKLMKFSVNKSAKNCKCIVYVHDKKAEIVAFEEN